MAENFPNSQEKNFQIDVKKEISYANNQEEGHTQDSTVKEFKVREKEQIVIEAKGKQYIAYSEIE